MLFVLTQLNSFLHGWLLRHRQPEEGPLLLRRAFERAARVGGLAGAPRQPGVPCATVYDPE